MGSLPSWGCSGWQNWDQRDQPWNIPGILDLPQIEQRGANQHWFQGEIQFPVPFQPIPFFFPWPVGCSARGWWSEGPKGCWKAKFISWAILFPGFPRKLLLLKHLVNGNDPRKQKSPKISEFLPNSPLDLGQYLAPVNFPPENPLELSAVHPQETGRSFSIKLICFLISNESNLIWFTEQTAAATLQGRKKPVDFRRNCDLANTKCNVFPSKQGNSWARADSKQAWILQDEIYGVNLGSIPRWNFPIGLVGAGLGFPQFSTSDYPSWKLKSGKWQESSRLGQENLPWEGEGF